LTAFKSRTLSWFKRRTPTEPTLSVVSVDVPDYKQERDYFCNMVVTYSDGSCETLRARVIQNQITKNWAVDGMKVLADVIEQ